MTFPPLPPEIVELDFDWRVPLPPRAAEHIGRENVFRTEDGQLVSPFVERVAVQWLLLVRKGEGHLSRFNVSRLLDALIQLVPGDPAGAWEVEGDGEPVWVEDPVQTEKNRTAAAYVLGAVVARQWRVEGPDRDPLIQRRLAEYADRHEWSRADAKVALCAAGLLEASEGEDRPQKVRIGRQCLEGPDGGREPHPVHDISARQYLHWLSSRAIGNAEDALTDRDQDHAKHTVPGGMDVARHRPAGARTPLDALVAAEAMADQWSRLLEVASPRQAEIIEAIRDAMAAGADEEEARAVAADVLDIAPSTVRVQIHRLKKKIESM